jgi:hypothetical protein
MNSFAVVFTVLNAYMHFVTYTCIYIKSSVIVPQCGTLCNKDDHVCVNLQTCSRATLWMGPFVCSYICILCMYMYIYTCTCLSHREMKYESNICLLLSYMHLHMKHSQSCTCRRQTWSILHMYVYVCVYISTYIWSNHFNELARGQPALCCICICMCVCVYIYIYMKHSL